MTGAELKAIRSELGLSQALFAWNLGVAGGKTTIYRWEHGHYPVPETVAKLARCMLDLDRDVERRG